MPCSPGMSKCRRDCLHRASVEAYRPARHAAELERERVTGGYPSEIEAYGPILTFKDWLTATAGERR